MNSSNANALRPTFAIRVLRNRAYIVRRSDEQPIAALSPAEAVLVRLLDGRRSVRDVEHSFAAAFGENMRSESRYAFDRLAPLMYAGPTVPCEYSVEQLAAVASADPAEGIRLIPGPRVLHWHVTQYCPRRCGYCYAEPVLGSKALDATISLQRLKVLFEEAVDLGASTILVSGAEPFVRRDLPEALGLAIAAGLSLLLTTKYPISASIARRLASARVDHISLSIDSLEPDENAWLVGSRSYASQIQRAMRNLHAAGIQFSIQSVVTQRNLRSIPAVASFAETAGARVMQLVPYKDVRNPITELGNADLRLQQASLVDELCDTLAQRHPNLHIERFVEAANAGGFHCDIGQTKLLILPDGVIHRCYKLTSDASLRGMDLKEVTLARGWHDPAFLQIALPSPSAGVKTTCGSCASKPSCDRSGRCIYDAEVHHGHYAAPDRDCDGRATLNKHPVFRIRAV